MNVLAMWDSAPPTVTPVAALLLIQVSCESSSALPLKFTHFQIWDTGVIVGAVLGTILGLILAGVVIAVIIFVIIKCNSRKKSVPLTARSGRLSGSKLGNSQTGSQDNLLDGAQDKVSVHIKPSRGYQPPPMRGSPAGPTRYKPAKPTPPSTKPAPVVTRYVPSSSNTSGQVPKSNGSAQSHFKPKPPAPYQPGPPPPSKVMPPPPSRAMPPPPPSRSNNVPPAPPRSNPQHPYSKGGSSSTHKIVNDISLDDCR